MTKEILYSFRRCPYAIRVRWALLVCEIKVEIREIDLKNKPLDFLKKSSTQTVPILIKKNKEVIEESLEIILWAISETRKETIKQIYLPNNKKREIFEIIHENDGVFKYHLDRFKYSTRFNSIDKDYHYRKSVEILKKWNKRLINNKYFFGEIPTIADWCLWPFVRQFKIACESQKKINYLDLPLKNWLYLFESHKDFSKLMYKYDLWNPSFEKKYFPI